MASRRDFSVFSDLVIIPARLPFLFKSSKPQASIMTIDTYFKTTFNADFQKLTFRRVALRSRNNSGGLQPGLIFGGRHWRNMRQDLSAVPKENRELFLWCLFLLSLTDQTIFAHFGHIYPQWSRVANLPKFACFGCCNRIQSPFHILERPVHDPAGGRLLRLPIARSRIPEAVSTYLRMLESSSPAHLENLAINDFANATIADPDFHFGHGMLARAFREEFAVQLGFASRCEPAAAPEAAA